MWTASCQGTVETGCWIDIQATGEWKQLVQRVFSSGTLAKQKILGKDRQATKVQALMYKNQNLYKSVELESLSSNYGTEMLDRLSSIVFPSSSTACDYVPNLLQIGAGLISP